MRPMQRRSQKRPLPAQMLEHRLMQSLEPKTRPGLPKNLPLHRVSFLHRYPWEVRAIPSLRLSLVEAHTAATRSSIEDPHRACE